MYHSVHGTPGPDFGKRQNLNVYIRWGKRMKRKHSYLKNSWDAKSPLVRRERLCTQQEEATDSVAKGEIFHHKHTSSQTLSPRKLLTELWQRIILPLADKQSPVLYLTHSSRRGGVGDALFLRGAVTIFSSVLFLQLSSSSGVLTPPPWFHIHPWVSSGNVKGKEKIQAAREREVWERRKQAAKPGNSFQLKKEDCWR